MVTLRERHIAVTLIILVVAAIALLVSRLHVSSDMGVFLPRHSDSPGSRILLNQLDRGATANLMFARISDATPARMAEVSRTLAKTWSASAYVKRVLNGSEVLAPSEIEFLERYRYAIGPHVNAGRFTVDGLKAALAERLAGLSSSLASMEKRYLREDPTGQLMGLLESWQTKKARTTAPRRHDGVWFSRDGNDAILVVETRTKGMDLDSHEASARYLQSSFADIADPGMQIDLTGPGAFAVETRDTIRADVARLTMLAVVFVGLFLVLSFRSITLLGLLFIPLAGGALVAAAAVQLVFGHIHGITLAFGITLIGVAIDYPIHFFMHLDASRSPLRHIRRIWPTLRLGVLTTTVAYLFLTLSDFEGLQQLGVFTMAGLLTAAAITRWLLPTFMPSGFVVSDRSGIVHRSFEWLGKRAPSWRLLATFVVLASAIFLLSTDRPLRDFHVDALSPIPMERRIAAREVRTDLSMWSGGKLLVVMAKSAELALQKSEALVPRLEQAVADGTIADFDMAAQFLPSKRLQQERLGALPERADLESRLAEALEGLPFRQGVFAPFIDGVDDARNLTPITLDDLHREGVGSHLRTLLFANDDDWVATILLHGVDNESRINSLVDADGDDGLLYLDLKAETSELMRRVIDRMALLLALGTICIYAILAFAFRDIRRPLRVLVPTVASVLVTSATLVATGVAMNLFHLTALLLVVGLGLDYALFFSRLSGPGNEWGTTFRSLWVCCVTTVLVFGLLIVSNTPPLHSVGQTAALGSALSLVFGAIWSSTWGQGRGLFGIERLFGRDGVDDSTPVV